MQFHRPCVSVLGEHLLTAGISNCYPEHSFAVVTVLDQVKTAVNRYRASDIADISGKRERRADY